MKPIFTIHAGEYLVASHIEEKYKGLLQIWLPSTDTGVDLLITNPKLSSKNSVRSTSLQVKFSKDFLGNKGVSPNIKAGGWWSFKYEKIEKSQADLWVLVLYSFNNKEHDFIIIEPIKLLERYKKLGYTSGTIQSYFGVTENSKAKKSQCWETRGLSKAEHEAIAMDTFKNDVRDFSPFLNIWQPLEKKIGL